MHANRSTNASQGSATEPIIARPHFLRTLATLLEGDIEIVVVEGQEGIGKSTLLHQFHNEHRDRTVAVYLTVASRWAYDPQQIASDIHSQISDLLHDGGEPPVAEQVDQVALQKLYAALRRKARKDGMPFYFIVDGLEDIPSTDEGSRTLIIDLLPFGMEGFRFLLSGRTAEELPLRSATRNLVKGYPLSSFSSDEAARFLESFELTPAQREEIVRVTGAVPGKLASIRRLLLTGQTPEQLLAQLPEQLPDLFRLEWSTVDDADHEQVLLLAILAHEPRSYSRAELAEIAQLATSHVETKLEGLGFLSCDSEGYYRFVSEAHRRFASTRVQHLRLEVNELLIAFFTRDPESPQALAHLPTYFTSADRLIDLVQYLSPERFARLYRQTTSLSSVQSQADQGIKAAQQLGRDGDLVRFTFQKAAIVEIASSRTGVAEVRARTAVGDYDTALALAEAAQRRDVRFRLLAAIARARKEQELPPDQDLLDRIKVLYTTLEDDATGEQVLEAAGDLFHVSPELALEVVSKAPGNEGENALDWARTRLSIQAELTVGDPSAKKQARQLQDQIKNPALRRLSIHAIAVLGDLPAPDVISEAQRIESTGDRLYLLQHWMTANRRRQDADQVLEYGLTASIQATGYTANARVYRALAQCLPYLDSATRVLELVQLLDAQRGVLEKIGPTEDHIRLQLILARAMARHDRANAHERLLAVYNTVSKIGDLVVQTASFGRLVATLTLIDPSKTMDETLHELVEQELLVGVDTLLGGAAEHYEVCKGVIKALAIAQPNTALAVIAKINTEGRRDSAYRAFVEAAISAPATEIPIFEVGWALDQIVDPDIRDAALQSATLLGRPHSKADVSGLIPIIRRAQAIQKTEERARVCADLAAWLAPLGEKAEQTRRDLLRWVREAWNVVDDSWEKLDVGFDIVAVLANTDQDVAQEYITETNDLQTRLLLHDAESTTAALLGLLLAIRAFAGLLAHNLEQEDDVERLLRTIAEFDSVEDKAVLLSELAIRCHRVGREELCGKIVQERLIPLLYTIPQSNVADRTAVIVVSAPALYLGSRAAGMHLINSLPEIARDEALGNTGWTILNKLPPGESLIRRPHQGGELTFEDASTVVQIMEEMIVDWRMYSLLESLVEGALASKTAMKRPQVAELVRRLEDLVNAKVPTTRNIQHEGYRIAARAQINQLRPPGEVLLADTFAADARQIPNTADRAYVLGAVVAIGRFRSDSDRRALLTEARQTADAIPTMVDRLGRYEVIALLVFDKEPNVARDMFRTALEISFRGEGKSVEERRRSLINAAHRMDPEFAAGLASVSDDDPAKVSMENQLRVYRLSDAMATRKGTRSDTVEGSALEYSRAAWRKLGSLNARRISPVSPDRALPLLQYAAAQPVSASYPIFAWFIENAVQYNTQNPATTRRYVLPLFEACLRGAELAVLSGQRSVGSGLQRLPFVSTKDDHAESKLIGEGEREEGLAMIREWLATQGGRTIYVVDPYFLPKDVHLLTLVRDVSEDARVFVITDAKSKKGLTDPEQGYRAAWNRLRQDDPPDTTIIFITSRGANPEFPVHDRWWLSEDGGVELGTSYGGLGNRLSRLKRLEKDEADVILQRVEPYFRQSQREHKGERLVYSSFDLGPV
ncbi:AAA family ATPase [Longimicrobium terrae]|uniref:ORC1/DEAH AAA+ ATPase domain-containing protein n=1 Tax=Longimicrobium terrae TaxID=1639882 RepID=A0A841GX02_9BACT|nr:hypothetical protein [Longimicrobium terrae]MBB6070015.1 hypothetical protein [Longimicrobium terrae]NNC32925.1 ATP-binding protein [Longimicrobium terrae]